MRRRYPAVVLVMPQRRLGPLRRQQPTNTKAKRRRDVSIFSHVYRIDVEFIEGPSLLKKIYQIVALIKDEPIEMYSVQVRSHRLSSIYSHFCFSIIKNFNYQYYFPSKPVVNTV